MPNKNYLKGRRLENKLKAGLVADGWQVLRSAGSKGAYDLTAFRKDQRPWVIQVKATSGGMTKVASLLKAFKANPAWDVCEFYDQSMWVWDGKRWHWGTV